MDDLPHIRCVCVREGGREGVCERGRGGRVCVCVCVRERERENLCVQMYECKCRREKKRTKNVSIRW